MNRRSILAGAIATIGLATFYLVVLTLVSGWEFTRAQAMRDAPYLAAILPLFGTQIGLYHSLRAAAARARATASGGMSGAAMVACCAHFLPTLLPYTGVAAFATVITTWRVPMLLLAIVANAAGITLAIRAIRANGRHDAMRALRAS